MTIRVLPPHVARLIAAGEVVSRPLDVVRECIENALDAGATRLEIEIQKGGLSLVRVRDNGCGIPSDSLSLAAVRHATSKLSPNASEVHVSTLGFRGEALWAIAQAAQLQVVSRPTDQLGAAELRAQGDSVEVVRSSAPAGTTVSVHDVFAHLPARLRTQAPANTEAREITALVGRYVLHWPQLHWRLVVGKEVRLIHAPSDFRGAVASVYGPVSANRVLSLQDGPISGVISRPELTRARRDRMHFSINGRPILAPPELEKAIIEAYGELLPAGSAPLCVLDLKVAPEDYNPNIHPTKQKVALADLETWCDQLREAVASALAEHPLARVAPALRTEHEPIEAQPEEIDTPQHQFPNLTFLNVYRELYLLAEAEGDLWIIDGHAAHERVLYERLQRGLSAAPPSDLPEPELLRLQPEQLARLDEREAELRQWGLILESFGAGLVRLRSVPAALATLPVPQLYQTIVETALGDHPDPQREVLAELACAPALKAGQFDQKNAQAVLDELLLCSQPWACPHGRPTTLRLSERDLAHSFDRRSPRDVARGRDERSEVVLLGKAK